MKKSFIAQLTAYLLMIIIITSVIISHNTLTGVRLFLALFAAVLGGILLFLLNRWADKNITFDAFLNKKIRGITVADILGFMFITIVAIAVRGFYFPYISPDVAIFQENWYEEARAAGIQSLGMRLGDYPPLYTTVFCLLVQLPIPKMIVIKFIPTAFDFVIAVFGVKIYGLVKSNASSFKKLVVYSVLLLNPISMLNSAAWGQCDSIYTAFLFIFLYLLIKMYRGNFSNGDWTFVFLGIAFACKLQTILVIPAILFLWIIQQKKVIRLAYFIWVPVMYFVTCIPMLLFHRTIGDLIGIYLFQTEQYEYYLTQNYANFYEIIGNVPSGMAEGAKKFGMLTGVAILLLIYLYLYKKKTVITESLILKIVSLTVFVLTFFLPSMHERYAIVGEILLLIIACTDYSYIPLSVASILCTAFAYTDYLLYYYDIGVPAQWLVALVRLTVLFILGRKLITGITTFSENEND